MSSKNNKIQSKIFGNSECTSEYIEKITNINNYQCIYIIFRTQGEINSKNTNNINKENLTKFNEIQLIFDFENLNYELDLEGLSKIINTFSKEIENINQNYGYSIILSLIIKNCLIGFENEIKPIKDKLILNKLEINDELYSFTTNLDNIFPNLEVNELVLKKFKFNSKLQLSNFCQFIIRVDCKILTLEDIFIELIIKNNEKDEEYKDLDIYFSNIDGIITLNNSTTSINSLTLRDCPLFAFEDKTFTYFKSEYIIYRNIDIDENSLINPSLITKFKIKKDIVDICFDLDSFKLHLEDENDIDIEYDFIDYLTYLFNILVSFSSEEEQIIKIREEDESVADIPKKFLHKLTFKNFDMTKLEYITDDDMTFIEEKNWILNEQERKKKQKWENFENNLKQFLDNFDLNTLSNVKELIFDNCSNFFIKWIIFFIKGEKINNNSDNLDFNLIKIKKCGKDYVNLERILTMKINKLILFDSPLIIGTTFPKENKSYLEDINNNLGFINNLTIKINSLDSYGNDYNLDTYKTLEILVELISNKHFNKNIIFEFNALSEIMTFLAFRAYFKNQAFYNDPNDLENGEDLENEEDVKKSWEKPSGKTEDINLIKEIPKQLPHLIFFSSKRRRDCIYSDAFNLKSFDEKSKITLKNMIIYKNTENFDYQNYLNIKDNKSGQNINNKDYRNKLKKIDFGSDGFYIDEDYKNFFNKNQIGTIELINVTFSNYKDSNLKKYENEGIKNLLSNDLKGYMKSYMIDMKTLSCILYINSSFEDFGIMFRYYMNKVDNYNGRELQVNQESFEKKMTMSIYFNKFKDIFNCFMNNIKELTIIINNKKELKEIFCTLSFYRILIKEEWIKEKLSINNNKKIIELPNKNIFKNEIGPYFLKEKDNNEIYSGMNYYYTSDEEIKMIKNKYMEIEGYQYNIKFEYNIDENI